MLYNWYKGGKGMEKYSLVRKGLEQRFRRIKLLLRKRFSLLPDGNGNRISHIHNGVDMKSIPIIVALVVLLPLCSSFSYAAPIEKTYQTFKEASLLSDNGTVTLMIQHGTHLIYKDGYFIGISGITGFTLLVNNGNGTKNVTFTISMTCSRLLRNMSEWTSVNGSINPGFLSGLQFYYFPHFCKITVSIKTDTSTNLSLTRSGYVLFSFFFIFTNGPESVTGPS